MKIYFLNKIWWSWRLWKNWSCWTRVGWNRCATKHFIRS